MDSMKEQLLINEKNEAYEINGKYIITVSDAESVFTAKTESALSLASELSDITGLKTVLLVFGKDSHARAGETAKALCSDVISVEIDKNSMAPDAMTNFFAAVFSELSPAPAFIIFPETSENSSVAPALAARLDSAWIQGVSGLYADGDKPVFSRSVWGGKFLEDISVNTDIDDTTLNEELTVNAETAVITVCQYKGEKCTGIGHVKTESVKNGSARNDLIKTGSMADRPTSHDDAGNAPFKVRFLDTPAFKTKSVVEGWTYGTRAEAGLKEARIIFSAGQGIGGPENIPILHELAELVPAGAVGCSRPVCDQGWMEYKHQIGITGAVVAPKLYIACGISGASQHIQGMQDSETVIAINRDANAPFFRNADIGIVEDVKVFLSELARQIREYKK